MDTSHLSRDFHRIPPCSQDLQLESEANAFPNHFPVGKLPSWKPEHIPGTPSKQNCLTPNLGTEYPFRLNLMREFLQDY